MRCSKGIVDEEIPELRQRPGEAWIIFFFAAQKSCVLEEEYFSLPEFQAGL